MFEEYSHHDVAIYGGYVEKKEELLRSTSGGIATALAERMIEKGGYVAGVAYSEDYYSAEYILINNKSDLDKLRGSKYIDTNKNKIYFDIKKLLEQGEQVLFIGLPCAVAALYGFIGNRPENLLTCELICHGPTSQRVHKEYISHLENKYQSKVVDFTVRYKKNHWIPSYLYARFSNGEEFIKPFYETEYGFAFSILVRESCYNCKFKGNNRQGDIMVGDYWGASERDVYWNKYGVSVIFAETSKGNDFIQHVPNIKLFKTSFQKAVRSNTMVIRSKKKDKRYDEFSKLLSEKGLMNAVSLTIRFNDRFVNVIKRVVPNKMVRLARDVFYSVFRGN